MILVCQEGYASSLAAALPAGHRPRNATDLDGGIAAWAEAGLPVRRGRRERAASDKATVTRGSPGRRAARSGRDGDFSHSCRYC